MKLYRLLLSTAAGILILMAYTLAIQSLAPFKWESVAAYDTQPQSRESHAILFKQVSNEITSTNAYTVYLPLVSVSRELLKNGDFEIPPPWPTQDGHVEVQVAPSWRAWYLNIPPSYVVPPSNCQGNSSYACYWMHPEFRDISAATFPQKVHGGSYAQRYFSYGRMHEAGLYQQVANVTPGSTLSFSVYMRAWMCYDITECGSGGSHSDAPADMHLRVGIDPTGGTDPLSSNIVWSAEAPAWDTWVRFQVQAVAQSSTVTVFTHSRAEWDWARLNNEVYIDDARLE